MENCTGDNMVVEEVECGSSKYLESRDNNKDKKKKRSDTYRLLDERHEAVSFRKK